MTPGRQNNESPSKERLGRGTFFITRTILIRYTAFIYAVAFLVALIQNSTLLGANGLLPVDKYLEHVKQHVESIAPHSDSSWENFYHKFRVTPTLLWLFADQPDVFALNLDFLLGALATAGLGLSLIILTTGIANSILMAFLWLLYHSIVNVGQRWYSFGWESQLLETGFLSIFICPLWSLSLPKSQRSKPSFVVIMLYRWLIFRIMLGAGLIKIRGDQCWHDLTCMNYHYETQPVPNPLSYFLHQSPQVVHTMETLGNHIVELVLPWLLLMPRPFSMVAGAAQIAFQVILIISGNLSFLNWLTILPSLACLDDQFWLAVAARVSSTLHKQWTEWMSVSIVDTDTLANSGGLDQKTENVKSTKRRKSKSKYVADTRSDKQSFGDNTAKLTFTLRELAWCMLCVSVVICLSTPTLTNLMSNKQKMNRFHNPLRIFNSYGVGGSITKVRHEVIVQGTHSPDPQNAEWREYEFKCKPGNPKRRPCVISPYHYRLDWLMWFAAFQSYEHNPWLVHLIAKLLENDEQVSALLDENPFAKDSPPQWIRAELYRYKFTVWNSLEANEGYWWNRTRERVYLQPVNKQMLLPYLRHYHWIK